MQTRAKTRTVMVTQRQGIEAMVFADESMVVERIMLFEARGTTSSELERPRTEGELAVEGE